MRTVMRAVEAMNTVEAGPRELLIGTQQTQTGGVLVVVRDSGPSIDPDHVDRQKQTFGQSCRPSRDNKLKDSPVWLATGGPQAPAVGFDDRAADCQSQSHAVGLCRVEWFKETREGLRA